VASRDIATERAIHSNENNHLHPVLYLNHDTFQPNKGAVRNPNPPPGVEIDMGFSPNPELLLA